MKITFLTAILLATNLLPAIAAAPSRIERPLPAHRIAEADTNNSNITPQQIRTHSTQITVRILAEKNGGSGVLIGKKAAKGASGATTYLVLTNKHVIGNSTKFQIKTADGKQYTAQLVPNTQISPKYDVALIEFTSARKYQLADLKYDTGSAMTAERQIYSAGFPFDSAQLRFTSGKVSQLSDVPLEDGTQIGYITNPGEKNIRQGMSGGPVLAVTGAGNAVVIGINTIGAAPLIPSYTYFDGSKPNPKRAAEYAKSNWGVPIYNLLSQLNPQILYQYDNLPKVQRQVTPTGYMAQLNRQTRQQTIRIEANGGNGSGVIVAKQGNTYYVLTAKHVVTFKPKKDDPKLEISKEIAAIAHDQESYKIQPTDVTLAEGVDLAVVKFTSNVNYPVARLGNYNPGKGETVFVAGYPARERIDSPLWQWQLNPGRNIANRESRRFQAQDKLSFESDGYDLIYTSISYGGMSGGPVFDTEGRVVGIHGKTEGDSEAQDWNKDLSFGNSLGISIQSFMGLATKLKVNPQLLTTSANSARDLQPNEKATVVAVRDSIPQPQADGSTRQWLQYGNQLHRIGKYADAVKAFDIAIAKGDESRWAGYYGRARAFSLEKKYSQALASISTAIANIPVAGRRSYYYMWQRQSAYYRELKKYPEAIKAIDIAIALEPTDRILFNTKAGIYEDDRQYQKAIAIYDNLINVPQPESYLFVSRGQLKLNQFDKSGALSDYNRAIALDPNATRGYLYRGLFEFRISNYAGAIRDFDKAISLDLKQDLAYSIRGRSKLALEDKSGALVDVDRAISIDPTQSLNYAYRAEVKLALGDKQGAALDFDKALAIDPSDTNYRNRASFRSKIGDKAGAISDFNKAVAIDPKESENYLQRGLIKALSGDYRNAVSDYNTAISLDPKKFIAYNGRAIARAELGDLQGALADYDRAILIEPDFIPASYAYRGDVKLKLGDVKGALLDYEKAIVLRPKEPNGYIGRGNVKLKAGDKQGALLDYEKAIALAPKAANGYVVRAKVKSQLGNKQGALADYDTAISIDAKKHTTYYGRSIVKLELGDKQGALADCDKAIAMAPPTDPLPYFHKANIKIKLGDNSGALSDLDKGIALDPNNVIGYNLRGAIKFELGDKQGALSDLNKLIAIEPKNDAHYNARSEVKLALGDRSGALLDLERAIALNPKNDQAYYSRGNLKFGAGDRQGAINDYTQAITRNPNNYNAYLNRGTVKFELGDLSAAMIDTDRAIALNPKSSSAYSNRGFFKILNGSDRDVLADLERAIQLDAKQSESYASRGFVRELSGDRQKAISDYKQAVRLNPQIVSDWKKQAGLIQKSNPASYQKYQQMIQKLEIGSRIN